MRTRELPVVIGAFGGRNIGDDAILESLMAMLSRPEGLIICLGHVGEGARRRYREKGWQCRSVTDTPLRSMWELARYGDVYIGGGQLIDQRTPAGLLAMVVCATVARLTLRPVRIVGVSVVLKESSLGKGLTKILFLLSRRIAVRDRTSYDSALEHASREKIIQAADLVLADTLGISPRPRPWSNRRVALIAVAATPARVLSPVAEVLATGRWLREQGYDDIALVAHDTRADFDRRLFGHLAQVDPTLRCLSPATVDEAIALYRSAELVISWRMHPIIMGWLAGAKVVGIADAGNVKIRQLGEQLGVPVIGASPPCGMAPGFTRSPVDRCEIASLAWRNL